MQPPKMKAEIAVSFSYPPSGIIDFYATPDAASEMSKFGDVSKEPNTPDRYWMKVDPRFSFAEVLAYIESYGK